MQISGPQIFPGIGPKMPTMQVVPQRGLNLQSGQVLTGQVLGKLGNQVTLQFGRNVIQAETTVPLETDAQIQVQVQGEFQGKVNLQLLRSQAFTPMSEQDLAQMMVSLKIPVNEENVALARGMLEYGVSLTSQNFREIKEALLNLPRNLSMDLASASFLKLNSLPMTTHNIVVLSNFITSHPLIGAQLFEIQYYFRQMAGGDRSRRLRDLDRILGKVPEMIGEYIIDCGMPDQEIRKASLRKMARQAGIEEMGIGPGGGQEDMDLLKLLAALRARLAQKEMKTEEMLLARAIKLLEEVEVNISAQRLINRARPQEESGFLYLQVPFRMDDRNLTAEVKIYFRTDSAQDGEEKWVDEENTKVEFAVNSEFLGRLHFLLDIRSGKVDLLVGVENEEVRSFLEMFLPALKENVEKIPYRLGKMEVCVRPAQTQTSIIEKEEFSRLERVNLKC